MLYLTTIHKLPYSFVIVEQVYPADADIDASRTPAICCFSKASFLPKIYILSLKTTPISPV